MSVDDPSRPSLHKSTPPKSGGSGVFRRAALRQPLTGRPDVDLRAECWDANGNLCDWRELVWEWRDAVEDNRNTWATFENQDGEQATHRLTDRFTPERHDQRYAQLNDLVDGIQDEYGRRLHTVMLSLTASSTDESGRPRPPVDHLLDVEASKDPVNSALDRVLDGRRWERIALPEQHKSGYIHWHWAIFVDGRVEAEEFQPVIDAHLRNCPTAEREAHEILPDDPENSAVSVRSSVRNLPAYLTAYTLGDGDEYGHDPLKAPEERQMMLALLWATNKRYWRPSDGAQEYMRYGEHDLPDWWATVVERWELVGLRDGRDGELREVSGATGGVTMLRTWDPPD